MISVKRTYSKGLGKGGRGKIFLRPDIECFNRSRSVKFFTVEEADKKIAKVIEKWFSPEIKLYMIEGKTIASNSEENALKEYWRVCELEDSGKPFEVKEVELTVGQ